MHDWGVDTANEKRIVRPVRAMNPGKMDFRQRSSEQDDLTKGEQYVRSRVRLLIAATGNVTKCTSLSHFAETEFNRITCDAITQRARYAPAELADGTKVPSFHDNPCAFPHRAVDRAVSAPSNPMAMSVR